ncbi:MAG: hypothetical protein EOP88_07680 [Verrucomicrobiaceae bacterium]|nr:MAG: hypothetical protein EOP88_07680 [Verrucomicrobiaceae bacterium]
MIDTHDEESDLRKRDRWCIGLMVVGPLVPLVVANVPVPWIILTALGFTAMGLVAGLRLVFAWWAPLWIKVISLSSVSLSALILYTSFR